MVASVTRSIKMLCGVSPRASSSFLQIVTFMLALSLERWWPRWMDRESKAPAGMASSIRARRYQELARKRLLQVAPRGPKLIDETRAKPSSQWSSVKPPIWNLPGPILYIVPTRPGGTMPVMLRGALEASSRSEAKPIPYFGATLGFMAEPRHRQVSGLTIVPASTGCWRRGWDLNPRTREPRHLLSRQALSTAQPPLRLDLTRTKNCCRMASASVRKTPETTSGAYPKIGLASVLPLLPTAPLSKS